MPLISDCFMTFLRSNIGKKMVMAITGSMMLLYLIFHLLGNLLIFKGPSWINVYASILHGSGPILWFIRIIMFIAFSIHLIYGIELTIENSRARPERYRLKKNLRSTFSSRNMIWTGIIIAIYVIYHLLHFTIPIIHPELSAVRNIDVSNRPDVFGMVVLNFQRYTVAVIYILAMMAVALHLSHGIQSLFQTLGLNNEETLPIIIRIGFISSIILLLGFLSIPVASLTGILRVRI